MRLKVFRIVSACMLLFWMFLIFFMSSQTAAESSATSGGFSRLLFELIYPKFRSFDAERQLEILQEFSFLIRKAAHFVLYAVLGVLSSCAVISYNKLYIKIRVCISLVICVLYSVSDEIHQYFVPGRSCEIRDVVIDTAGAILGIICCFFTAYIFKRIFNIIKYKK